MGIRAFVITILLISLAGCGFHAGTLITTTDNNVSACLDKKYQGLNDYRFDPAVNIDEALLVGSAGSRQLLHLIKNKKAISIDEAVEELEMHLIAIRQTTSDNYIRKAIAIAQSHDGRIILLGHLDYEDENEIYGTKIRITHASNQDLFLLFREIKLDKGKIVLVRENIPMKEYDEKAFEFSIKEGKILNKAR